MANETENATTGALLAESVAVLRRNWQLLLIAGVAEGLLEIGQLSENRDRVAGVAGVLLVLLTSLLATFAIQRSPLAVFSFAKGSWRQAFPPGTERSSACRS